MFAVPRPFRRRIPNARAEYSGFRHPIPAQSVCSMHAAGIFPSGKQALEICEAIAINSDAAHVEMCSRANFDFFARKIGANAQATLTHAREVFLDEFDAQ